MSLSELLEKQHAVEEELIFITMDEYKKLLTDIPNEVDSAKVYVETLESIIAKCKKLMEPIQAKKLAAEKSLHRLKEDIRDAMIAKGHKRLDGNIYRINLVSREVLKVLNHPDDKIINELGPDADNYIKTKRDWNRLTLEALYHKRPDVLEGYAEKQRSHYIQMRLN